MKYLFCLCLTLSSLSLFAQTYRPLKTAWQLAGCKNAAFTAGRTIDICTYGADPTGNQAADDALVAATAALQGRAGTIYFPKGSYLFHRPVVVGRDSLTLKGAGHDQSVLRFDLGGALSNLISINGQTTNDTAALSSPAVRGAFAVTVRNAALFRPADWVVLSMDDASLMTSTWAYGSLAQTLQVQRVQGDTVVFASPLRLNAALVRRPQLRRVQPCQLVSIECLKVQRLDATAGQSSNIAFDRAVRCRINGVESERANFAHVEVNRSSNIEVTNSYLHEAFAYGGNGQGYGLLLQFGSGECLAEANYFDHLRHSMLLQAGANGNVLAYNYSTNPHWDEPNLPDSSAGDLVLHGNYPFLNLAEGNFVRNIVIDDSHGKNGPLNTFLRNRASGYGVFMNFLPATDSVQFIGNEVTHQDIGLFFVQGAGHFTWGNALRGNIPDGQAIIPDSSMYLPAGQRPRCAEGYDHWPAAGRPGGYNTGTIYAQSRALAGAPAACSCVPLAATAIARPVAAAASWELYPNPAHDYVQVRGMAATGRVTIYDATGRLVLEQPYGTGKAIDVSALKPGMYLIRMQANGQTAVRKLVLQ